MTFQTALNILPFLAVLPFVTIYVAAKMVDAYCNK
jgi:hypothetical protein